MRVRRVRRVRQLVTAAWLAYALGGLTTCAAPRRALDAHNAATASTCRARIEADPDAAQRAVVVVVLDGARWQDVFAGLDAASSEEAGAALSAPPMPRLRTMSELRGVAIGAPGHGAIVRASGPNFVSLPGYTEMFSGRPPVDCADNECDRTRIPTVADELRACATSPRDVAVFSSWPEIERAASTQPEDLVVSAGRHTRYQEAILRETPERARLLDQGADAEPSPGNGDFRPDRFTASLALHYLEIERPRFLFLGLGEPDELAHAGDYEGYLGALHYADTVIDELMKTLDRLGERGRHTTVLITADHGRAHDFRDHGGAYPESARVWLIALGGDFTRRGTIAARHERRLADLAPTIRATFGLMPDASQLAGRPIAELLPPTSP